MLNESKTLNGKVITEYEKRSEDTHVLIQVIEYELDIYETRCTINGEIRERWVTPDDDGIIENITELLQRH